MGIPLWFRTITPIHIGSGNKINPEEYFYKNNKLFRINLEQSFRFLGELIGYEEFNKSLNEWTEHIAQMVQISGGQKSRSDYRISIFDFVANFLKNSNLKSELERKIENSKDFHLYTLDCANKPVTEVEEIIKLDDNSAYIPGSSIKGVIRTALLFTAITENIQEAAKILERLNLNSNRKYLDDELEKLFLICRFEDSKGNMHYDAKYDLLKFIGVRDAVLVDHQNNSPFELAKVDLFLRRGSIQKQSPNVELLKNNLVLKTEIFVDVNALKQLAKKLNNEDFIFDINRRKVWIGLAKKFNNLFNVHLRTLKVDGSEEDFEKKIVDRIFYALKQFSDAVLNSDLKWFEDLSRSQKPEIGKIVPNLKSVFEKSIKPSQNKFKIGWASGFTATTVLLALANNPNTKPLVEKIINNEKLVPKKVGKNKKVNLEQFPVSRRLKNQGTSNPSPLGWIEFSTVEIQSPTAQVEHSPTEETQTEQEQKQVEFPVEMKITKVTQNIPAKVVNNSKKPFEVELLVKGYENKTFKCSGVDNLASIPPGTLIYAMVTDFDPKRNEIRMLKFQRELRAK